MITITVGYIGASLAAGMTLVLAVTGWATGFANVPTGVLVSHVIYAGGALTPFVAMLAFPAAAVAALIGELFAIRNGFFYIAAGGLIAALGYFGATDYGIGNDMPAGAADEFIAFLAAGLVAGAAYWLIAGSSAGLSPRREEDPPAETLSTGEQQPHGESAHQPREGVIEHPQDSR